MWRCQMGWLLSVFVTKMKTSRLIILCGSFAALILPLVGGSTGLQAQENIVALGRVNAAGVLLSGTTAVGGIISTVHNGTGDYTVNINATGVFTGAVANDFIVQVSLVSTNSGDDTIKARVTSVTNDLVSLAVHTDDVEDTGNPDGPLPTNINFSFVLLRVPSSFPASAGTRYLIGTGTVSSAGALDSGVGVGGITVTSSQLGTGDYKVLLSKPGGFVADLNNDYVLSLTNRGSGVQDQVIRGGVADITSDDYVAFNVHTDDVQDFPDASIAVPASESFYFAVYRLSTTPEPLPESRLLTVLARVDFNGTLFSAGNSFDGGILTSSQVATGHFRVEINSSGAFAGRNALEFVALAHLDQPNSSDEAIRSDVTIINPDTLQVDVYINDVEKSGEFTGVPTNANFFLSLFDSKADLQPDLRIGEKASLTKMGGDDLYNATGAGQQMRLPLVATSRKKYFFALENDGNVADNIQVKESGAGSRVRTNYFQITGGRVNVTAQVKKLGKIEESLNPGATTLFEGRIKYLSNEKRPRRKIRLAGTSLVDPSAADAVRLKVSGI